MGLKTKIGFKYVKLKDGKLFLSTDKENSTPYDELEGRIVDIGTKKDTFEGTVIERIYVVMDSGDGELYNLSFNIDGSYASSFMNFVRGVNFSEPLTLKPVARTEIKDGKEIKRLSILIEQDGKFMKAYHTKDNPNGLPPMQKVTVSGKTMWDKTDMINFYKEVIANVLKPALTGASPVTTAAPSTVDFVEDVNDDDLPF